jgi:hypothetical protein
MFRLTKRASSKPPIPKEMVAPSIVGYFIDAIMDGHIGREIMTDLTVCFPAFGLYAIRLGELKNMEDAVLCFLQIRQWITFARDPSKYKEQYLWKCGFTSRCFRVLLRKTVQKLNKYGFPMDELHLQRKGIVVGLPQDLVKLLSAK